MDFDKNKISVEEYLEKINNNEEFFCIIVSNRDEDINNIFKNYGTARKTIYKKLSKKKLEDFYLSVDKLGFEVMYGVELPVLVLMRDKQLAEIVELKTVKKDINSK